ncbi:hypothetical protein GE09DRAFT_74628 [Coniochaeta sp. 2T2.1]|nr:hypothetical protein GE09DRAFT_74628 [Coniochaeta sp. 2T2.1]
MATIEPRLIHLLNNTQSPAIPPAQLRSQHNSNDPSLSLAPIEDDKGGNRRDRSAPQKIPPIHSIAADFPPRQELRSDGTYRPEASNTNTTNVRSLHQLLGDPDESLQLAPLAHHITDTAEDVASKKRQRALTIQKELYGPLPQPLKKQKSTQQVVPPIISGLHEPPQDAAVFPPIVGHYDDAESSTLNPLNDYGTLEVDRLPPISAPSDRPERPHAAPRGRAQRRIGKRRKKWSEQETDHLMLGVSKYGVGKWTSILEDPEYSFNERTAGDLKDRFRTCCPEELKDKLKSKPSQDQPPLNSSQQNATPDRVLNEHPLDDDNNSGWKSANQESDSGGPKKSKGRAHRKNVEDLEALGIKAPFKKSERRERRPFTAQDDAEILEGLKIHGPSWTKIQRDVRFNLSNRQPTDLRDRVRNKFPEAYRDMDKGTFASIQKGRGTTRILEPSVGTSVGNPWDQQHLPRSNSRDNVLRPALPPSSMMDSFESLPGIESFDRDVPPSTFMTNGEEMAISRLMIEEERQVANEHRPGSFDDRPTGPYRGRAAEREPDNTGNSRSHQTNYGDWPLRTVRR